MHLASAFRTILVDLDVFPGFASQLIRADIGNWRAFTILYNWAVFKITYLQLLTVASSVAPFCLSVRWWLVTQFKGLLFPLVLLYDCYLMSSGAIGLNILLVLLLELDAVVGVFFHSIVVIATVLLNAGLLDDRVDHGRKSLHSYLVQVDFQGGNFWDLQLSRLVLLLLLLRVLLL